MPDIISHGLIGFYLWLFSLSAIHKIRAASEYESIVMSYLPGSNASGLWVKVIAAVEFLIAVLLVFSVTRLAGLASAAILLLIYAGFMGLQVYRGKKDINCGCAGPASTITVGWGTILRNGFCAVMALLITVLPVAVVEKTMGNTLISIGIAVFLVVLYLSIEQVIANDQTLSLKR